MNGEQNPSIPQSLNWLSCKYRPNSGEHCGEWRKSSFVHSPALSGSGPGTVHRSAASFCSSRGDRTERNYFLLLFPLTLHSKECIHTYSAQVKRNHAHGFATSDRAFHKRNGSPENEGLINQGPDRVKQLFRPQSSVPLLSGLKNSRISRASTSGCSSAAKWPPSGMTVHRLILA